MNKIAIIGLALAVVLVSASLFSVSAQAECFSCMPHISWPSCLTCQHAQDRDYDRPDATCQGAYRYGPSTPTPMGSIGY